MAENLFELAARKKFRFASPRGELTVEQLFDLPLTSKTGLDLDTVARTVNGDLKKVTEESFVTVRTTTGQSDLEAKLDLVKSVIATKQKAAEELRTAAERADKRRVLLSALANKEAQELGAASKEDILKQLADLD